MAILDEIIRRTKNLPPKRQEELLELLKDWQQGKEREFQRLKASAQVDVAGDKKLVQSQIKDISASGIYINTSGKFETDERVRVVFTVPQMDRPFKLQGKIVRVEQHGMAIKFEKITPYFKTVLDDAIWKHQSEDDSSSE